MLNFLGVFYQSPILHATNESTDLSFDQAREEEVARRAEEEKAVEGDKLWPAGKDHMGVSVNGGTSKSSILIGFSILNHPFWSTPIFGNTHMFVPISSRLHTTWGPQKGSVWEGKLSKFLYFREFFHPNTSFEHLI